MMPHAADQKESSKKRNSEEEQETHKGIAGMVHSEKSNRGEKKGVLFQSMGRGFGINKPPLRIQTETLNSAQSNNK